MAAKIPQSVRESQLNALPDMAFVRWEDGRYVSNKSKAVMRCTLDGHVWSSAVTNLSSGRGCPKCAGRHGFSAEEIEEKLNALPNKSFVRWADGAYSNCRSKAIMLCCTDGCKWSACVSNLLAIGSGCPKCAGQYRYSSDERELQLKDVSNITFVKWADGGYKDCNSKAVVRCDKGHSWEAGVRGLIRGGGCPRCAKYGYNPAKAGTLYALRSECGQFIKIGISNDFKRRCAELRRATPFSFAIVATLHSDGETTRQLEKLFHGEFESSGHDGFSGATEWLKFNPDILSLLRIFGA